MVCSGDGVVPVEPGSHILCNELDHWVILGEFLSMTKGLAPVRHTAQSLEMRERSTAPASSRMTSPEATPESIS